MNIYQKFHLRQGSHEITFSADEIEKVEKMTPYKLSRIYIPECSCRDTSKGCDQQNIPQLCCMCYESHLQECYLDGWQVCMSGRIEDDDYVATLCTGLRVPVKKNVFDAWMKGWDKDSADEGWVKTPDIGNKPTIELS